MKNLYTWLVIRAFRIKEVVIKENIALTRSRQNRKERRIRNAAVFLSLASILLLLITFFIPRLNSDYKFSKTYNTASIINTCSGCITGICFLILIALVSLKNSEENKNSVPGEKIVNKEG